MNKTLTVGGALAGLLVSVGLAGTVSAQNAAETTAITEVQAIEIALKEVAGVVEEIELEREDGAQVYEIEIMSADGVETEVEINAETGEVLEVEVESEDDDDREDA